MLSGKITGTSFFKSKQQLLNISKAICAGLYDCTTPVEKIPDDVIKLSSSYIELLIDIQKDLCATYESGGTSTQKQTEIFNILRIIEVYFEKGCDGLVEDDFLIIEKSHLSAANTLQLVLEFELQKTEYLGAVKEYLTKLRHDLKTRSWQIGVYDVNPKRCISELESKHPIDRWHWVVGAPIDLQNIARVLAKDLNEASDIELLKKFEMIMTIIFNIPKSHWRHQETNNFYREHFSLLLNMNFMLVPVADNEKYFHEVRRL